MEPVKIEYFGHACFRLSQAGRRIVLDPYADGSVAGCPPLRLEAEAVYCSHDHGDHNAVQCVTLTGQPAPKCAVTELETDHDDAGGKLRGKNIIRIFDFDGLRIAHFGDLGRLLTAEEIAQLRDLDCALIPVGGYYTIDAATAAEVAASVAPRLIIPMHYRTEQSGLPVIAFLEDALPSLAGLNLHVLPYGGSLALEANA
jgi:L-ascorbate metabolism protein UlaG (beta-lactamase superfamily)